MPTPREQVMRWLRLAWGGLWGALALLALLPAPTTLLWMAAVVVTEWGHWLALPPLLALLPGWRRTAVGRIGGTLGLGAALLALTPLLRAAPLARQLGGDLVAAFGPSAAPARSPLSPRDLLLGVPLSAIQPESRVYTTREGRELRLDLYRPSSPRPAPGLLVIHGGSWSSGDSTQLAPLNSYLAARGYLVAAINYRLLPEHPFPAARDDVRAALDYLKANADTIGLDRERIVLLGRSAGGQLALLVAYSADDPAIKGVVSFYAPADLRYGYEHPSNPNVIDSTGILEAYIGGSPTTAGAAYDAASPIRFVGPQTPATLLVHGGRDELVTVAQSERLAQRLAAAGRPHLFLRLPWATHGCDYNFNGPSGQLSTYAIEGFLSAIVGTGRS